MSVGVSRTARGARMSAWRAHAYGGPAELRLEAARVPVLRASDELVVRVNCAGLNPLDVAMLRGYGARALSTLRALERVESGDLPLVPGREFCGRVERAGGGARLHRGARVWGVVPPHWPGALAELVRIKERWAGAAPAGLSDLQAGGALYAGLTACSALRAGGVWPEGGGARGRAVLVLGLGGVGQAALQLLAAGGARVLVGCASDQAEHARELGAHHVLDRHAPDYEAQLVEGGPYAAVVDCAGLGGEEAARHGWRTTRYVTLTTPLLREMDARGATLGAAAAGVSLVQQLASSRGVRWAYFMPRAGDIELLRRLSERGQFRVCVQRAWRGAEAPAALEAVSSGPARGKLVLDMSELT